jgi:hypothetical protein
LNFDITPELLLIGGMASTLVEILRALLLNLEAYPRIKALWSLLPSLFGALLVLLIPSAVPCLSSLAFLFSGT